MKELVAIVNELIALIRRYPEFEADDETDCLGSVTCPICDGGGTKRQPPKHREGCLRAEFEKRFPQKEVAPKMPRLSQGYGFLSSQKCSTCLKVMVFYPADCGDKVTPPHPNLWYCHDCGVEVREEP